MRLTAGMTAVVTGAASGIGAALAESFAGRGLDLALADVDGEGLEAQASRLRSGGVTVTTSRVDVADRSQVLAWADATFARFGHVDVVANNAGIVSPRLPTWELPPDAWDKVLGVNLGGVVNGLVAFLPRIVARGKGHILNTGSMAGISTVAGIGPYTASKFAIVGISEALKAELRSAGSSIGVSVLSPGFVVTGIGSDQRRDGPVELPVVPGGLTAADVAEAAMEAIEADLVHVVPSPGSGERIKKRNARLEAAVATQGGARPLG